MIHNPDRVIRVRRAGDNGLPPHRFLLILDLDQLPQQSNTKIRQIFSIIWSGFDFNEEAIEKTEDWLRDLVSETRSILEQAKRENRLGHVDVKPRSRRPEDVMARLNNKELENAEHEAQRNYNRAVRLQTYFNQERK